MLDKMQGISWLSEVLFACQEGLCPMETISYLVFLNRSRPLPTLPLDAT